MAPVGPWVPGDQLEAVLAKALGRPVVMANQPELVREPEGESIMVPRGIEQRRSLKLEDEMTKPRLPTELGPRG